MLGGWVWGGGPRSPKITGGFCECGRVAGVVYPVEQNMESDQSAMCSLLLHRGEAEQSPMGLFPKNRDDRVWVSNAPRFFLFFFFILCSLFCLLFSLSSGRDEALPLGVWW